MYKSDLRILREYIIGWIVAVTFWVIVRSYGVTVLSPSSSEPLHIVRVLFLFAPIVGFAFGVVQIKMESLFYRRVPLWQLSTFSFLINTVLMIFIFMLAYNFFKFVVGFNGPITFLEFIVNPSAILIFFYSLLVNFVLASIRQIDLLLGEGNLWRFIRGDFYSPTIERRIFMFMDLRGSTTIAEELGHIRYSRFLQDCFFDLRVVQKYGAEVYQYVGDEVVLSWRVKKKTKFMEAIKAFWAYEKRLEKRRPYYEKRYGFFPVFKAGINEGEVTAAEVGEIKRAIAYHGDTINVASRIQELCNSYECNLLVTEHFYKGLDQEEKFEAKHQGTEQLRGKQVPLNVYSIHKKGTV